LTKKSKRQEADQNYQNQSQNIVADFNWINHNSVSFIFVQFP
jgi:hypothetical protein